MERTRRGCEGYTLAVTKAVTSDDEVLRRESIAKQDTQRNTRAQEDGSRGRDELAARAAHAARATRHSVTALLHLLDSLCFLPSTPAFG